MEILNNGSNERLATPEEHAELNRALAQIGFYSAALDEYEVVEREEERWIGRSNN